MNKHNNNISKLLLIILMLFIFHVTAALNDDIAAISSSISGYLITNEDEEKIEKGAHHLAAIYAADLIPFTVTNLHELDDYSRRVILRAITRLPDKSALCNALYSMVMSGDGFPDEEVITAISYCNAEDVINISFRLASTTTWRHVGRTALELLEIFGSSAVIDSLKKLEERVNDPLYKNEISECRNRILQRMSGSSTSALNEWRRLALAYWQIPREVPDIHNITLKYFLQAEALNMRGYRFPIAFLKERLERNEPLAAALIAVQKENDLVEDMKRHIAEKSVIKEICRLAIDHINGTNTIDVKGYFTLRR